MAKKTIAGIAWALGLLLLATLAGCQRQAGRESGTTGVTPGTQVQESQKSESAKATVGVPPDGLKIVDTTERPGLMEGETSFEVSLVASDASDEGLVEATRYLRDRYAAAIQSHATVEFYFFDREDIAQKYLKVSIEEENPFDKYLVASYVHREKQGLDLLSRWTGDRPATVKDFSQ